MVNTTIAKTNVYATAIPDYFGLSMEKTAACLSGGCF
jgi:hypothetical protein